MTDDRNPRRDDWESGPRPAPNDRAVEVTGWQEPDWQGRTFEPLDLWRVVADAGPEGVTKSRLRDAFPWVGKDRFERTCAELVANSHEVSVAKEICPDRSGRPVAQWVYRVRLDTIGRTTP